VFFFSSRRRHTRWPRDWSSDVCSSDLRGGGTKKMVAIEPPENEYKYPDPHMFGPELPAHGFFIRHAKNLEFTNVEIAYGAPDERSEERRVGKEGRSEWAPRYQRKTRQE